MERNTACEDIEGASEQTSAPGLSKNGEKLRVKKQKKGEWRGGFIFLPHPLLVFLFPLAVSFPWRVFVNECLLCGHVKKPIEKSDGTMSRLIRRQIVFRLPCQTRKLKNPQAIEEES